MKVLYITSEAAPFAVTGGLGDVAGSLPQAIRARLVGCRIVMPLYQDIPQDLRENMRFVASLSVPVSWRRQYCGIFEAKHNGVIYYLLDNQYYFKRAGLYGHYDDAERFAFLSRAALEIIPYIDYQPDIIHANDWQTALTPIYHRVFYQRDERYASIKTIFTIHNIQYQGQYGLEILEDVLGLPQSSAELVSYGGDINLVKGAIETADRVTTVSPSYARELLDPWYSHKLDPVLSAHQDKLSGILNGIDVDTYNPEGDPLIYAPYTADDLSGKAENKARLQERLGLPVRPDVPLLGMVTRLVSHKGLDLVKYVLDEMLSVEDMQMVILGTGDWVYESFFQEMQASYPDKLSVIIGFIPELSHKIYAASDLFLMPSKSEPCGLSQMIALRYGSVPIVRETGGLKDSITDSGDNEGNGFTFKSYNAHDMLAAIKRAIKGYYGEEDGFTTLVGRAMRCDNSWGKSANEYIRLYRALVKG